MRTFGTILALLLIFFGLVVAGLLVVRLWQGNDFLAWGAAPTATPTPDLLLVAAGTNTSRDAPAGADLGAASETDMQRLFVGVESGGMALGTPEAAMVPVAQFDEPFDDPLDAPADEPLLPTLLPQVLPPADACPPQPAEGFAADSAVVAVGMLRVYSQSDVTSPALAELQAGQGLWIIAGEDGSTAVTRCEMVWQRVRTADGVVGWALEDAIDVVVPTPVPLPTMLPTGVAPMPAPTDGSACPSGCTQGGCALPCPTPCTQVCPAPCIQPCVQQPCTSPCGVLPK
jgi:hypothetical protein